MHHCARPSWIRRLLVGSSLLAIGCTTKVAVIATLPPRDAAVVPVEPGPVAGPDAGGRVLVPAVAPPVPVLEAGCGSAALSGGNAGCSFFATEIPLAFALVSRASFIDACFAMVVVNPGGQPARLALERAGTALPLAQVARLPRGAGGALRYGPFDPAAGLPPGEVAVLFLSGSDASAAPCPAGVTPATPITTALVDRSPVGAGVLNTLAMTGVGRAFHLTSDRPVIAYQVLPFNAGRAEGVTSATLLLPQESWGRRHPTMVPRAPVWPVVLVTAGQDGTEVSFRPSADVVAGEAIPWTRSGTVVTVRLDAGQFVQFTSQPDLMRWPLSGSIVESSKPVSVIAGAESFLSNGAASSAHQQVLPVEALGHEYVAVKHKNRGDEEESEAWQIVGAAAGTALTYLPSRPPAAPPALEVGQVVEFDTRDPFVVRSQDADHPFALAAYMRGGPFPPAPAFIGGPQFLNVVSADRYVSSYTFFTDPTYQDTNLVVVRKRDGRGRLADVSLGCRAGALAGWQAVGDFEFAHVDLVNGETTTGCDNGLQTMNSAAPFAVTVWGWSPGVCYAYPVGAGTGRARAPVIK